MLDLKTFKWSQIEKTGPDDNTTAIMAHSLVPISGSHLLLTGGVQAIVSEWHARTPFFYESFARMMVFDVQRKRWKKMELVTNFTQLDERFGAKRIAFPQIFSH